MARVRTFLAIELPPDVREGCVALQDRLAVVAADFKWVEEENLHLTLLFLGEVHDRDLAEVCRAVQAVCARFEPFTLVFAGAGCFGDPRRPRTIWVGLREGADQLVALHDALEEAMLELRCYRREERRFTPHVTLGRARGDRPGEELPQALARERDWHGGECRVEEVRVLSSELTREGPVYAVLSRATLGEKT